jgi:hypothetical protein
MPDRSPSRRHRKTEKEEDEELLQKYGCAALGCPKQLDMSHVRVL